MELLATNLNRMIRVLLPIGLTLICGFVLGQSAPQAGLDRANFHFTGRYLVSVSDADMLPSAYIDGKLGPVAGQDALSLIRLDRPVGDLKAVEVGVSNSVTGPPSVVGVSPDGRYALTNAMYYGADISGTNSVPASVLAVRLAADTAARPVHQIADRVLSGVLSEGLAISPDGRWLATTNLEQSSFPLDSPRQGFFASVTLIRFDPQPGLLERVGTYAFDGLLPESVVFDNTSRFLAVTTFAHSDPGRPGGSIDFWRITGDSADPKRTELVRTNYSVPVTRGGHTLVIVR